MADVWPQQMPYWHHLEQTAHQVLGSCGYGEIRTPILESMDLFQRSVGESSDIVRKEMYTLQDRKGRTLALRPEGTAAVVRALIENGRDGSTELQKYYYIGPMFRYERPQKGRMRQFHQMGAEVFGSTAAIADVDLLLTIQLYLEKLGLQGIELHLNSLGDEHCRPKFRDALQSYLKKHLSHLCADCQTRYSLNPLRVLDCKEPSCSKIIEEAPTILEHLCSECRQHLNQVETLLRNAKLNYHINPRMARGLDYYNRTVFEFLADSIGAKSAVCGGGRYDNLVKELGGKATPAIGFAMGLERLILLLEQQKPQVVAGSKVWFAVMSEQDLATAVQLAFELRQNNISCQLEYQPRSLKNQLSRASKQGALFAVILGKDELAQQRVSLKNLMSGHQESLLQKDLLQHLQTVLGQ